jgi:hypothetical protein
MTWQCGKEAVLPGILRTHPLLASTGRNNGKRLCCLASF